MLKFQSQTPISRKFGGETLTCDRDNDDLTNIQ